MNAISTITRSGAPALMPASLTEAMSLATMMSQSKLVPAALQKSPADCLLVIEQAMRWGMSPFAVAQEVSVIQGKMMFSGKIVAAAIHTAPGVLKGRLKYEYSGKGADLAIRVVGSLQGEDEPRDVDVTLASAKTGNQWWSKTPEQMLSYHGARVWARRHAPEVMLGVYAPEEFDGVTIEAPPQPQVDLTPRRAAPQITRQTLSQALDNDQIPDFDAPPPPKPPTPEQWIDGLIARLQAMQSIDDYNDMQQDEELAANLAQCEQRMPKLFARYDEARQLTLDRLADGYVPPADSEAA